MNYVECTECGEEFKVVHESDEDLEFCPFCGMDMDYTKKADNDDY
jgi:rRNA maturation endonuclease Nob1